jgi:hypothetical protein
MCQTSHSDSIYSGTSISQTSKETKNIRVIENLSYRNTFFLLVYQLNLHQAYVLYQEKHGEDLPAFCLQNI